MRGTPAADDLSHLLPIWLLGQDSNRFTGDARPGLSPDELTGRLLRAAGARVAAVNVDELGPEVTVARIELATLAGPGHATEFFMTSGPGGPAQPEGDPHRNMRQSP